MSNPARPGFLEDIPVEVSIELGRRRMSIRELAAVDVDDVLELDQQIDDPINLMVGGRLVARGELVAVGTRMALRITEIVGQRQPVSKAS